MEWVERARKPLDSFILVLVQRIRTAGWREWLKAYGAFAIANVTLKLVMKYLSMSRIYRAVKHLKGKKQDFTGREILENLPRIHDYMFDLLQTHPNEELVRSSNPELEVICRTPRAVEKMLKGEFPQVTKPHPSQDYLFQLLGEFIGEEGIFVMRHGSPIPEENSKWYTQRKTASKIFTKSNFSNLMYDTLLEKTQYLVDAVQKVADKNSGLDTTNKKEGAIPIDLQEKFFCFTFDSIQRIFFNRDVDSIKSGTQDPYARAFDDAHREVFLHHFSSIGPVVLTTNVLPFPFGSLLPYYNAVNPGLWFYKTFVDTHYRKFRKHVKKLNEITYNVIQEVRKDAENLEKRKDLLAFFLRSNPNLSDKQLHDIMLNFIIAGRDTTACTMTWLFYELAINQDVQTKVAEEVRAFIGKDRMPTLDDLHNFTYLQAAMMETLRLHPPVPFDYKIALAPITFDDGTTVPAGTRLLFTPYSMGRDPARYENPTKFMPERWLGIQEPSMFEFPVFQAGPRFCLGKDLAKNETKLVTALLLQKFSFHLEANEKVENISYSLMATMSLVNSKDKTSHHLWLVPKPRA